MSRADDRVPTVELAVAKAAMRLRYDCARAVTARAARAAAVLGLDAGFSILGFALEP